MPAVLRNYTPVTEARLRSPSDGDWMMNRRTYDGWGYSPLTQITPANVARLKPVWSLSTGAINGHEAAPIVHDGVMFVATPGSQVIAIEAATGTVLALSSPTCADCHQSASDDARRGPAWRQGVPGRE
jgi:alcohol dehydrogenase (cytochrome c)